MSNVDVSETSRLFHRGIFPRPGPPSRSIHPIQTMRIGASVLLGWNEKRDVCEQKAILCLFGVFKDGQPPGDNYSYYLGSEWITV